MRSRRCGSASPTSAIQVEVERLSQAVEAIEAGARFLLLDNMPDSGMRGDRRVRDGPMRPRSGRGKARGDGGHDS